MEESKKEDMLYALSELFYKTRKTAVIDAIEMIQADCDIDAIRVRFGIEEDET